MFSIRHKKACQTCKFVVKVYLVQVSWACVCGISHTELSLLQYHSVKVNNKLLSVDRWLAVPVVWVSVKLFLSDFTTFHFLSKLVNVTNCVASTLCLLDDWCVCISRFSFIVVKWLRSIDVKRTLDDILLCFLRQCIVDTVNVHLQLLLLSIDEPILCRSNP